MKKSRLVIFTIVVLSIFTGVCDSKPITDINAKVAQLDIDRATVDDVIRIFGEPEKYFWGRETFTKDKLPRGYIAGYPNKFSVVIVAGRVSELRFESAKTGYLFLDKIHVGSSLDEVLEVIGKSKETVVGASRRELTKDGVLYKDIDNRKGFCYYSRPDQGARFFFGNYKVSAIYVTRSRSGSSDIRSKSSGGSFRTVQPIESVKAFDDVRYKDLSKLDLSGKTDIIATLTFNSKTVWPAEIKMWVDSNPNAIMTDAMNPGLGICKLHEQGITGKGINVAIIDQPMYLDHPEFVGKIAAYHDVGCGGSESSMHGPAVASLLVGTNCGTAPEARVYYVAAPSWTKDAAYYAEALDWIIEQSNGLPASEKIRVVSVSAAPSGQGSPFEKHNIMWDRACSRAKAAGILVLDCTSHQGIVGACWYDANDPENVSKCTPGFPGQGKWIRPENILAPSSTRTTAEEYDKGDFSYQYCGRGGLSWAIPYCAGVLALGWQVNPELSSEQMSELLFKSAYVKETGEKIINPSEFIRLVRKINNKKGLGKKPNP
ncbi:S8 family serine peptidase [Planctomycetota bacterium]